MKKRRGQLNGNEKEERDGMQRCLLDARNAQSRGRERKTAFLAGSTKGLNDPQGPSAAHVISSQALWGVPLAFAIVRICHHGRVLFFLLLLLSLPPLSTRSSRPLLYSTMDSQLLTVLFGSMFCEH